MTTPEQWQELVESTPAQIRGRMREIMDSGKSRLVATSSAGPISQMSPRLIRNYRQTAVVMDASTFAALGLVAKLACFRHPSHPKR